MRARIVPRPSALRLNPCRRVSLKPVSAWGFRIVLPQAMRTAFPPLSNSLISMVKDTSLAANITVTEMFMVTQRIVARTYEPLLLYLEVGLIYLVFSTVLTWVQRFGEKKLASYGHKEG